MLVDNNAKFVQDDTIIMTRDGIKYAYSISDNLNYVTQTMSDEVTNMSNIIKGNESFNIFANGTDYGHGLSESLDSILNDYNELVECFNELLAKSNEFLEEQERINSIKYL